jgi:GAF domain-containing protein
MASRTTDITSEPGSEPGSESAALRLLRLLANNGTVADITELDAPETERDLALRIREDFHRRRRREVELSALVETARDLASLSDPNGVLDAIVRRARTLLGTDLAYLTLFDAERGDTYMRATDGSISAEFQSVRLSLGDGLGGLAAKTRKAYWTADYFADHRFQHTGVIDHAVADEGIVAICGTPLIAVNDFVGVLFAANRSPRPFTHDEVALLSSLATLAAVSLVQVRALAETEHALAALSEAHETVRRHTAGVERAAAAHDRFADLVLSGGGADDITKALVDLLGGWAVVLDDAGVRRSEAGDAPDGAAFPGDRDPLADGPPGVTAIGSGRLSHYGDRYAVGIAAGHEPLGLLVLGGLDLPPDDADRRTVERAAMVTALVLLFERQTTEAQQQMRTDLVADLVAGRGDRAELMTAARAYGLDPTRPFCLLALVGDDSARRRALVLSTHAAVGSRGIVGEHDGVVVALVTDTNPGTLATSVSARLGRTGGTTVAGVGPLEDVAAVPAAFTEAVRTVRAMIALGHSGTGAAAAELGFAGLVVGSEPDVGAYVQHTLGPLSAYDEARGTDLVGTLESYFAAGGSPRHTATLLHVHVNTVAQRLERVANLLGPSWQQPDRSLEIQLALRLRRLMPR